MDLEKSHEIMKHLREWINTNEYNQGDWIDIKIPKKFYDYIVEYCKAQDLEINPYEFICIMIRSQRMLAEKYASLKLWCQYDANLNEDQMAAFKEHFNHRKKA